MTAAALPRRTAVLTLAARVVSWPLTAACVLLGLVWRLVTSPFSGESGGLGGLERAAEFGRQGLEYLLFQTDRMPSLAGRPRVEGQSPGPWHEAKRRLVKSRIALWSWIGIAVYFYVGLAAQCGWVAADYRSAERNTVYAAPQGLFQAHVLGTDQLGRDVAKLALRGTTTALWIGVVAAFLSCFIGTVLGAIAGYFGGFVDQAVVWLFTTVESIPYLLLLLAFVFVFQKNPAVRDAYGDSFLAKDLHVTLGLFTMVLALGVTSWVGVCRTVRGEFIRQRDRDYVTAAKALGVPTTRIIFGHVLPNVFHLVLVSFSLLFISAVKFEVILSFLGLGLEKGEASWGLMISGAKLELLRSPSVWWQLSTATVFMFGLVLSVNLFSDALRDALDPRLKS